MIVKAWLLKFPEESLILNFETKASAYQFGIPLSKPLSLIPGYVLRFMQSFKSTTTYQTIENISLFIGSWKYWFFFG